MAVLPHWLGRSPAVLAHRGGGALGPENSLDTLRLAAHHGADAVEIDVQQLGDDTLVLHHDAFVIDGEDWRWLRDLTLDEFSRLHERPVTATDLLECIVATNLGVYLELKAVGRAGVDRLVSGVVEHGMAERTVIASFRHDITARVAADGRVVAAALYRDRFADPVALAHDLGCHVLHPCFDGDDGMIDLMRGAWIDRVHDHGVAVVGWNTNDVDVLRRMVDAGFDVVCTDDPRCRPSRAGDDRGS